MDIAWNLSPAYFVFLNSVWQQQELLCAEDFYLAPVVLS